MVAAELMYPTPHGGVGGGGGKAADNGGLARAEWPTKEVSSGAPARQPAGALHTNPGLHPATHKLTLKYVKAKNLSLTRISSKGQIQVANAGTGHTRVYYAIDMHTRVLYALAGAG